MSFGLHPIAQAFRAPSEAVELARYDLQPAVCYVCQLFQLVEVPDPGEVFRPDYPYASGTSRSMTRHLQNWAEELAGTLCGADPFVLEIGSNDGTFLSVIAAQRIRHLGVEPAAGVATAARARGIDVFEAFFNPTTAEHLRDAYGPADLVVAANVIGHIPDLPATAVAVRDLLKPEGVFTFEAIYLGDVLANTAFDQLYDEHVFTLSVTSVHKVFRRAGLELIDVSHQPVQGGSMRYVLAHHGRRRQSAGVARAIEGERRLRLDQPETYRLFAERCERIRDSLLRLLIDLRKRGHEIAGYGATAKSTTLLNYACIGPDLVSFIADCTPAKQGKFAPGSGIPVRSPEYFDAHAPSHTLLLAWNHRTEIEAKLTAYRGRGGSWILYVPHVTIA